METKNTYKLKMFCGNCGFEGEIEIPKGIASKNKECPNCGITELERIVEPIIMRPDISDF